MKWCYLKYDRNSTQPNLSTTEKAQSYRYVQLLYTVPIFEFGYIL